MCVHTVCLTALFLSGGVLLQGCGGGSQDSKAATQTDTQKKEMIQKLKKECTIRKSLDTMLKFENPGDAFAAVDPFDAINVRVCYPKDFKVNKVVPGEVYLVHWKGKIHKEVERQVCSKTLLLDTKFADLDWDGKDKLELKMTSMFCFKDGSSFDHERSDVMFLNKNDDECFGGSTKTYVMNSGTMRDAVPCTPKQYEDYITPQKDDGAVSLTSINATEVKDQKTQHQPATLRERPTATSKIEIAATARGQQHVTNRTGSSSLPVYRTPRFKHAVDDSTVREMEKLAPEVFAHWHAHEDK